MQIPQSVCTFKLDQSVRKMAQIVCVVILSALVSGDLLPGVECEVQKGDLSQCQYWSEYNQATNSCKCGSKLHNIVDCDIAGGEVNLTVNYWYCMSLNTEQSRVVIGACPYHYIFCPPRCTSHQMSVNVTRELCGPIKRRGQLCGQCVKGYSSPVYSNYVECVRCRENNWLKYLAISLLPETVFLLAVTAVRFRSTSPSMNGYILMCQFMTSGYVLRFFFYSYHHNRKYIGHFGDLYFSLVGIWNLDFFKLFYAPFCLHPEASTLQVLSLEYLTALYPLLLILLTYTLVRLHYKNCRIVVWLWRLFIPCFARCRRQWDIQNSLIDAFATFLLLSYVKICSVSLDLLTPTLLWNSRGAVEDVAMYYDGTVRFFGKKHLPYAIPAITALLVFNIFPILLLLLYPCNCFQRLLNRLHLNSTALTFFMDSFQGSFKDGTNGTRDCRWFSAIYLILRLVLHLGFIVSGNTSSTFPLTVALLGTIVILTVAQPYKNVLYCKLDIVFLAALCVIVDSAWELHGRSSSSLSSIVDRAYLLLLLLPLFYQLWLVLYCIGKRSVKLRARIVWKLRMCWVRFTGNRPTGESNDRSPLAMML